MRMVDDQARTAPAHVTALERPLDRWLTYWHGRGDPHQYEYFRCLACRKLVTWHQIRAGGCRRCHGATKLAPAAISWPLLVRLLLAPWSI